MASSALTPDVNACLAMQGITAVWIMVTAWTTSVRTTASALMNLMVIPAFVLEATGKGTDGDMVRNTHRIQIYLNPHQESCRARHARLRLSSAGGPSPWQE